MRRIARSAIMPHSAARLYALVEDIESYPRFLPWCVAAEVQSRSAEATRARLTVAVRGVKHSFTTQNENRAPAAIDLKLVEGPFRHFAAHWRFHALGAQAARIEFAMEYEFTSRAVAAALGPVFHAIADTLVDAFKRRADAVYGQAAR